MDSSDDVIRDTVFAGGALMPDTETAEPFAVDLARKYFRDVVKGIRYLHSKGTNICILFVF